MFTIRVICAPHDVGPIVHTLARTFTVRGVKQLPTQHGDLERLYIQAERRADTAAPDLERRKQS